MFKTILLQPKIFANAYFHDVFDSFLSVIYKFLTNISKRLGIHMAYLTRIPRSPKSHIVVRKWFTIGKWQDS